MSRTPEGQWPGPVADDLAAFPVDSTTSRFRGRVWDVLTDSVTIGDYTVERDYVAHTGAVAVIALDDLERVYLLRQYRHPVGMYLFEPPAGLLDVDDEPAWQTAARELAEEAGLEASSWSTLVDFFNSPGGSSEAVLVHLARGVTDREGGRIQTGEAEEIDLPGCWIPIDDAVSLILQGQLGNPTAVVGVLAVAEARRMGWTTLRPVDAPWPVRDNLMATGRVRTDVAPRH